MNRCPARDDLQRYVAHQLAPDDHAALATHLDDCPACRAVCTRLDGPAPTVTLRHPPPPPTLDDTADDHAPLIDVPTCRLWRQDQAPRPGERPTQTPGFDWPTPTTVAPIPVIPGYEVLGELGRGGMGVVYKARQVQLNRFVALKMILTSELSDPENLIRFRTEAEAVARLQHPNIVQVYEVGTARGRPYYSLEYVGGGTLAQHSLGVAQPPDAAATLVETLARAIHYAHQQGVVHRDLKPANVLLSGVRSQESGIRNPGEESQSLLTPDSCLLTPKITDFGLAKYTAATAPQRAGGHTRPGLVVGTPQYMAPEQADGVGGSVGPTVDVYSLGAILYELLTGRPPFQGATAMDTLMRARCLDPVPPRFWQPKVPRDLETITLKCLEKEPRRRYASAADLADDLRRFRDGKPTDARPAGLSEQLWKWVRRHPTVIGLATTVALLVVFGCFGLVRQWRQTQATLAQTLQARARDEERRERAESGLYLSRVAQAQLHFQAGHTDRAVVVLDLCKPRDGQPDRRQWEWHYLDRLCRVGPGDRIAAGRAADFANDTGVRPGSRLAQEGVTAAALSLDGQWLATVRTGENAVRVRDAASEQQVAKLTGLSKPMAVAFSPNGQRLAALGPDGELHLWDVATWQEALALPPPVALAPTPEGMRPRLAFSPDGTTISARLMSGEIAIWDAWRVDR